MAIIWDFLTFKRMASPYVLQILFWAGVGGSLYGTYVLLQLNHWAWPFPLIFGPLVVRVVFERAIIAFRSYDRLVQIADGIESLNKGTSQ